ncbi:zinc-dependent metalloprotease [Cellulomonas edaphi]|uniref:Zinc-dependent metalloprotease n=1 Tax=Cellulomonas edaphi TaxID=3053468 RepID=A0ABT7S8D8_9CELL|nr:zinc-dependent metalloprotease [Cellulomons edaphi]MDM7831878.1 zinc-dependent metalloprotease [Cellulomons edaphi]
MSSDTPAVPGPDGSGEPWEQMLRAMLGPGADEAIRELRERGIDPSAMPGLPTDPVQLQQAFTQMQSMLAASGDEPVNWQMAHDLARQQASAEGDPSLTPAQTRQVLEALTVAELWLDAATELPPASGSPRAWSRAEWVEATLPTWRTLTEPVATSLSHALVGTLGDAMGEGLGAELEGVLPGGIDATALLRRLGSAVFGLQVGQAAGTLARDVFGTTDIGLPLLASPAPALVASNVDAFAAGLDAPVDEVRLFLALREAAATRLFTHVPWLRAHLLATVEAYARGITIDAEQLEEAVRSIDPTDAAALQQALSGGVFAPHTTPEQKAALERLETALALVEGWVDEVAAAAAMPHLPHTVALREMIRRRRAAGGPAEQTFATLVGLELRPRRLRDAAALWAQIARDNGTHARDAVWDHPDLLPTAEDLDDPAGYATRRAAAVDEAAEVDRALAEILGEEPGTP